LGAKQTGRYFTTAVSEKASPHLQMVGDHEGRERVNESADANAGRSLAAGDGESLLGTIKKWFIEKLEWGWQRKREF